MTKTKTKGLLALAFMLVLAVAAVGMFSWGTSAKAANSENTNYQSVDLDFSIGTCRTTGSINVDNVNWPKTDKLNFSIKAAVGTNGARIRFKVRHYWGNDVIKPGNEIVFDEFTIGSDGKYFELWSDHGGIPSGTGTSNQRWNCNFSVVWLQAKCGTQKEDYRFILNYDDGKKDTFFNYEPSGLTQFKDNFSNWEEAW